MNNFEEKFFKTFEIKPKELEYPDNFEYYPEITDRILLELICILNKYHYTTLVKKDYNLLRNEILQECYISYGAWQECNYGFVLDFYKQVQSLFTEEEE